MQLPQHTTRSTVNHIRAVFGKAERKLFLVRWEGYEEEDDSWETEHSLLRDGCKESIDEFWLRTKINPALDFYPDPDDRPRCWMCGYTCSTNTAPRFLKCHITKAKHNWHKQRAHLRTKLDIKHDKLEAMQDKLQKVKWGDQTVSNCWRFEYLGSDFVPSGDHLPDVRKRIAQAKSRAGRLRHILQAKDLEIDLRIRLYISGCCSILAYDSEAWSLDDKTCKTINGANSYMLSHITDRSRHEESSSKTTTFNLILWIRARRLKWLVHILRLQPNKDGEERLIKQAVRHIHEFRREGDLLMDMDANLTWSELQTIAADRKAWKIRVSKMRARARGTEWINSNIRVKQTRKEVKIQTRPGRNVQAFTVELLLLYELLLLFELLLLPFELLLFSELLLLYELLFELLSLLFELLLLSELLSLTV